MTYNVFSETLNPTHSLTWRQSDVIDEHVIGDAYAWLVDNAEAGAAQSTKNRTVTVIP